ncbi:uncharacterized protein LOC117172857 isoform X2 [Belonocnema kinseyi]|uniref:uncharacterized protein LOC117172857 isoform X2 n=1 Tax=Belonocnema kinseyi TaxID=2817044 RepID=UPI00143DBFC8|nr:uncharacterized protein LOC117172857 isoform X2 [Belonocnema kinseyi]
MDFFDQSYFRLTKVLMCCIGQWPYQPTYQRIIISSFISFMHITFFITLISGIANSNNFDDSINILTAIIMSTTCYSKLINSVLLMKEMKYLLGEIKTDWSIVSGPEVNILKKFAVRGQKLSLMYVAYIYFVVSVYLVTTYIPQMLNIIKPLNVSRPRKRTYKSNYFIDEDKYYYHINFHEQITVVLNMTTFLTMDAMYVVYTEHICGMFAILGYRIENLFKDKINHSELSEDCSLQDDEKLTKEVSGCLLLHQKNIEYAKKLGAAFSASVFCQVGLSMILLSITGYVTIIKLDAPDEFMKFFSYVLGQIVYIFYICLPGQKIMDASENIVSALGT